MKKIFFTVLSLFSISLWAGTVPKIAYKEAKAGKAIIIDVREKDELKPGMVEGALSFPLSEIEKDQNWKSKFLKETKGKKIYLYCRSGKRSGKALELLKAQGIPSENIGGFQTLKDELPVACPLQ